MRYTSTTTLLALVAMATTTITTTSASSFFPGAPEKGQQQLQHRAPVLPLRPIAQSPFEAASYIVGGEEANKDTSKWTVALVTNSRGRLFQFCGGTLIAPKFVVTAAHCVEAGYEMSALVGRYTLSDTSSGVIIPVVESFVHPTYNPETMSGDIAILRLEHDAPADIPIIPLIPEEVAKSLTDGKTVTVLGWGLQEERGQQNAAVKNMMGLSNLKAEETVQGSGSDVLRSVSLPIVPNDKCNTEYKDLTQKDSILDEQVCAGVDRGGLDSCQGDSGGPLVADVGGVTYLFGVVSWGIGCARPKVPGVYTRVAFHSSWLASKMLLEVATATGRGLGATNVLFAGTDRKAELGLVMDTLSTVPLDVSVSFPADAPKSFSVDQKHFALTPSGPGAVGKTTITYTQSKPGQESTNILIDVSKTGETNKDTNTQSFGLAAFALPLAEFGAQFAGDDWYTGKDKGVGGWEPAAEDKNEINSGVTKDSETSVALHYFKGSGELSFQWKTSCEETYDLLYLFLDNEPVDALTGESGWVTKSLLIEGAADQEHTVAFAFVKDKTMAKGDDRAYVKDVHFGAREGAGMERLAPITKMGKKGKGRGLRGAGVVGEEAAL